MTESLLTAGEVAELLGVPVSWVYEQSRQGRIPTVTLGRYRRYRQEAIEVWVQELESGHLSPITDRAWASHGTPVGRSLPRSSGASSP